MSGKATSAKITIYGEVTSPDKHMYTVDQRPKIMSGAGTLSKENISVEHASPKELMSSENAALAKTVFAQAASSSSTFFLDELQVGVTGTIIVMLCRIWDVSAVTCRYFSIDMVVSDARGNTIHCTARSNIAHNFIKLKEGGICSIKNFVVHPNKEEFRIRKDDTFMLEFDGATSARKSLAKSDGFVRHPFQFVELDSVELSENKYMIDIAGYITNVGRSIKKQTGFRTLDFYLANQSVAEQTREVMPVDFGEPRAGTLENLLLWARNHRNDDEEGLELPNVWRGKVQERTRQKAWGMVMYRLELGVSDETGHVLVIMFDETASELVKCSADSIAQADEEASVESAGSSTTDAVPDVPSSPGKRLCKHPSMLTPLKPSKGKNRIREELEDSNAESLATRVEGKKETYVPMTLMNLSAALYSLSGGLMFIMFIIHYIPAPEVMLQPYLFMFLFGRERVLHLWYPSQAFRQMVKLVLCELAEAVHGQPLNAMHSTDSSCSSSQFFPELSIGAIKATSIILFAYGQAESSIEYMQLDIDVFLCMEFTDVAQVADAARNFEILRDRDDYDRPERSDKWHKSGVPASSVISAE
ncbi:zinc finger, CCHC-type containing protein [Tanacetum coccineum]